MIRTTHCLHRGRSGVSDGPANITGIPCRSVRGDVRRRVRSRPILPPRRSRHADGEAWSGAVSAATRGRAMACEECDAKQPRMQMARAWPGPRCIDGAEESRC